MMVDVIYCADGNKRFAALALNRGLKYGAQLPNTIYFAPYFVDQDWRKPNRERYVASVAAHRPSLATVLDWERPDQESEVMAWAEDIAPYVETVIIIPKWPGCIDRIPRAIGGKPVRLGYSVPTKYGATRVSVREFAGWDVHLLGGSPSEQLRLRKHLHVASADGNYAQMMAIRNEFYDSRGWRELRETVGFTSSDAPYIAADLSFLALAMLWAGHSAVEVIGAQIDVLRNEYGITIAQTLPMPI